MTNGAEKIAEIWRQKAVPVLYREGRGRPLLVRLPYRKDNYGWLRDDRRPKPKWIEGKRHWEIPMSWFNDIVNRALSRWGAVYIIQPYRHQEKCAPACWNAEGHECECSCMGANHGSQGSEAGWFVVSETFATKWRERELACRLLRAKT